MIYSPNCKKSLCHWFCTQNGKISLFGLTFGHKRSRDSVMVGPIFANLVSKYARGFKEKTHEIARREVWRTRRNLSRGGPPRPPPSAVRVKQIITQIYPLLHMCRHQHFTQILSCNELSTPQCTFAFSIVSDMLWYLFASN